MFRGLSARDPDSNVNGQVEYFIENETESLFKIELPHQGIVRLAKPLDYESDRIHFVTIVASVLDVTHILMSHGSFAVSISTKFK